MSFRTLPGMLRYLAFLVLLVPLAASGASGQERRIALVIGVSTYQNAPRLANPVNDARAIGESLRRLNFEVTELYDPGFAISATASANSASKPRARTWRWLLRRPRGTGRTGELPDSR